MLARSMIDKRAIVIISKFYFSFPMALKRLWYWCGQHWFAKIDGEGNLSTTYKRRIKEKFNEKLQARA